MLYRSDAYSVEITARDTELGVASEVLDGPLRVDGRGLTSELFVLPVPRSSTGDVTNPLNNDIE